MIFYGVLLENRLISRYFDIIRYLSQPDALRPTHITIRGPYKRHIDISRIDQSRIGDLCLRQPGHFFLSGQQTVYLKCEIVGIRDVWNKPNFPNGVPHLTIYDGPDNDFAAKIHMLLLKYPWNMWLRITNLVELEKKTMASASLNITEREFVEEFYNIFGFKEDIALVKNISKGVRLEMMEHVITGKLRHRMMPE